MVVLDSVGFQFGCMGRMQSFLGQDRMKLAFGIDNDKRLDTVYQKLTELDLFPVTDFAQLLIPADFLAMGLGEVDADWINAGFPCQPWSSSGQQLGALDARADCFRQGMKYVSALQPKGRLKAR